MFLCPDLLGFFKIKAKIETLVLLGGLGTSTKCRLLLKLTKILTKSGHRCFVGNLLRYLDAFKANNS